MTPPEARPCSALKLLASSWNSWIVSSASARALKSADVAGVVDAVERELVGPVPRTGERVAESLRGWTQTQERQVVAKAAAGDRAARG